MEKYRLVGERRSDEEITFGSKDADSGKPKSTDVDSGSEKAATEAQSSSPVDNEVRITQQGKPRNYISYAMSLFEQHGHDTIQLKGMGRAINKCVTITEILKRKMPLHQITKLTTLEIIDVFEPLEEGLDVVESKRYVSCMVVTLSKTCAGMDTTDIGYQPPLPLEEIQPGDLNKLSFERSKTPTLKGSGSSADASTT